MFRAAALLVALLLPAAGTAAQDAAQDAAQPASQRHAVAPPDDVVVTPPEAAEPDAAELLWARAYGGAPPAGAVAFLVPDYASEAGYDAAPAAGPPAAVRARFGIARLRVIVPQRPGGDPDCLGREAMRHAVAVAPALIGLNLAQARAAEAQIGPALGAAFAARADGNYDERVRRALSEAFARAAATAGPALRKLAPITEADGRFAECARPVAAVPAPPPPLPPEDLARTLERLQRR